MSLTASITVPTKSIRAAPRSMIHCTTPISACTIFTSAPAGFSMPSTQEMPAVTIFSTTNSLIGVMISSLEVAELAP